MPTAGPRDATSIASRCVREGARLVVVAGGDGTINEAANGLVGSATAMGIVPIGTANVLACELRLGRDPVRVARKLAGFEARRIAVGRMTNAAGESRCFVAMAGAGFDARINGLVRADLKNRFGKLAYWWAGVQMTGRTLAQIDVRAEGRRFRTGFALTARVRNYGGELAIAAKASLFEDRFELVTFRGATSWPYLLYLGGAVVGRAAMLPGVESIFAQRVELAAADGDRVELQVDGEQAGELPAVLEVVPGALTLLVPEQPRGR